MNEKESLQQLLDASKVAYYNVKSFEKTTNGFDVVISFTYISEDDVNSTIVGEVNSAVMNIAGTAGCTSVSIIGDTIKVRFEKAEK